MYNGSIYIYTNLLKKREREREREGNITEIPENSLKTFLRKNRRVKGKGVEKEEKEERRGVLLLSHGGWLLKYPCTHTHTIESLKTIVRLCTKLCQKKLKDGV